MKTKFDIEAYIINFLGKSNLLESRKTDSLDFLRKKFNQFETISSKSFDSLERAVIKCPQNIIDILTDTFTSEIYTTTIAEVRTKEENIHKNMSTIALHWEISSFYTLPAYLLSDLRVPIKSLTNKKSIFSQLREFGFDPKTIEDIRIIRNAKNHKFTVKRNTILLSDGNENKEITMERINEIRNKLETFSSWWLTFLTTQFLYLPSFGLLSIYTFYNKAKSNIEFSKEYADGLLKVFPDLKEIIEKEKK